MISNPKDAAIYIIDTIKEISPIENHFLDQDIVEWIVEDLFYEQLTPLLTETDIEKIEKKDEDDEYFREYCQVNIPKYYSILEDIANTLIADYLIEDKEIHEIQPDSI